MNDVTICIPSIPPRYDFLRSAIKSVQEQTTPAAYVVAVDENHDGAWVTRNRAASMAKTEWIGFLDDDDRLMSHHVEHLLQCAQENQADMVWGWFAVVGGSDPFPHYRGRQYDPQQPHIVPITYLVRREVFMATDGFQWDGIGSWDNQDQPVIDQIYRLTNGAMFASHEKTWWWRHHGRNTSGMPTRW